MSTAFKLLYQRKQWHCGGPPEAAGLPADRPRVPESDRVAPGQRVQDPDCPAATWPSDAASKTTSKGLKCPGRYHRCRGRRGHASQPGYRARASKQVHPRVLLIGIAIAIALFVVIMIAVDVGLHGVVIQLLIRPRLRAIAVA